MKENVAVYYRGRAQQVVTETLDIPPECPHCGGTMSPKIFKGFSREKENEANKKVGVLVQCSFETCSRFYSVEFKRTGVHWTLVPATYSPEITVELPENIEKVSPDFVEIYSQATVAESEKLDQIAGVGYRKAAEFLIKDYAIRKNPDDEEQIKANLLGKVINKYLDDFPKVQKLATAAAWIGNDETHYVRRHNDKDIKDLKRFIKAAAQFIAADYDADEALEFTSDS